MGDGINDAPAMKAADVGISVDTAVDVAKESADIILLEKASSCWRTALSKVAGFSATSSSTSRWAPAPTSGTCSACSAASIFLPFLPMTPIQILVNNLLYDFSQTAIPLDNVDEELLEQPRRWNISFIRNS